MALVDLEASIIDHLADGEDVETLQRAFELSHTRIGEAGTQIPFLVEAHTTLAYWLAVAKDEYRRSPDDKFNKFAVEYLEAGVKSLNTAIIASLGLRKMGVYDER